MNDHADPAHSSELPTPALVIDGDVFDRNLAVMAAAHPGPALRPHVKAHKCTSIAAAQASVGHLRFTCATPREVIGMAAAGLGHDLLLANETVDAVRLRAMAGLDNPVTVAVDSDATLDAAVAAGIERVLIDVNVGLPRCGVAADGAGHLADLARSAGLEVRGVMGYEGHLMMVTDRAEQAERVEAAMALLRRAHADVGGDIVSAGGTGTFDLHEHTGVNEVQAGSYALMDIHYGRLGLPFEQAVFVLGTVISVGDRYAVADVGLKALGMDHGDPDLLMVDGSSRSVWFCSDEHITFSTDGGSTDGGSTDGGSTDGGSTDGGSTDGGSTDGGSTRSAAPVVGDRVKVVPAHVDPTMAMHEVAWVVRDDRVTDRWPIDLRGW